MKKQRILSALLTLCLVFSLVPTALAAGADDFTDVSKDSWCYDYVDYVTSEGYFRGTTDTTFSPNRNMTRAMFVVVLSRFDGARVDNSQSSFTDVEPGSWCAGAIEWAAENGIVTGKGDGRFAPNDPITRAQMCAIMDRYVDYYTAEHDINVAKEGKAATLADQSQVPAYAVEAVKNCQIYGLINGYEDGTFRPQAYSTRAHVAAIVYRLAFLLGSTTGTVTLVINGKISTVTVTVGPDGTFKVPDLPSGTPGSSRFIGWKNSEDGKTYKPGASCKYVKGMELTARYSSGGSNKPDPKPTIDKDDLIGNAVQGAIDQARNNYIDTFNNNATVKNEANELLTSASISITDVDPTQKEERNLTLTISANITDTLVAGIVEHAAEIAVGLFEEVDTGNISKEDVKSFIQDIIAAFEESTGIDLSETNAEDIADKVYDKMLEEGSSLWANFREGSKYYTGDVTVKVEGKQTAKVLVEENTGNSTKLEGSKKQAVIDTAEAIAKAMYADLKEETTYTSEVKPDSKVTLEFSAPADSDFKACTEQFPYVYNVNVVLNLNGGELVDYKFDGKSYVRLHPTFDIQWAYARGVDDMLTAALDSDTLRDILRPIVIKTLEQDDTYSKLQTTLSDKYGVNLGASDDEVKKALLDQVDNWLDANLTTLPGKDCYLPYEFFWDDEGTITADGTLMIHGEDVTDTKKFCDNTMLVEAIWNIVKDDIPESEEDIGELIQQQIETELKEAGIDKAWIINAYKNNVLVSNAVAMLKMPGTTVTPDVNFDVQSIEDINKLIDAGTVVVRNTTYDISASVNIKTVILTEASKALTEKLAGSSLEDILNRNETVKEYLIYSALVKLTLNFDSELAAVKDEALKALADDSDSGMIGSIAKSYIDREINNKVRKSIGAAMNGDGELAEYASYLPQILNCKGLAGMTEMKLSNLATLLRDERLLNQIGSAGNSYTDYLGKIINKLPAGAIVTVNGTPISKAALSDFAEANTTHEACLALADIIDDFGDLSMSSFAEPGIPVKITYNAGQSNERNFEFNLVVAVEDFA